MTLAQEGYNIMKEMPSRKLIPVIQLLRVMQSSDGNDTLDYISRISAFDRMEKTRLKCAEYLPEDFDPEEEYAAVLDDKYDDHCSVPVTSLKRREGGFYHGEIKISPDFDEPLGDFEEYM